MIAHRRADVAELNALARARMHRDGRLSSEQLVTAEGRAFAVGDHVLARRNDRRAEVVNGMRGRVVGVDLERGSVTIEPKEGDARTVDRRYLDEGWLDHGYALTAHAAQGATVHRSFVLGSDELYREWGYTALSRHEQAAHFYVVSPGSSERALPGLEPTPDPLAGDLGAMLGPSRRKVLAIDVANPRLLRAAEGRTGRQSEPNDAAPRDVAAEEVEAARARIAALAEERDALGVWQREAQGDRRAHRATAGRPRQVGDGAASGGAVAHQRDAGASRGRRACAARGTGAPCEAARPAVGHRGTDRRSPGRADGAGAVVPRCGTPPRSTGAETSPGVGRRIARRHRAEL